MYGYAGTWVRLPTLESQDRVFDSVHWIWYLGSEAVIFTRQGHMVTTVPPERSLDVVLGWHASSDTFRMMDDNSQQVER